MFYDRFISLCAKNNMSPSAVAQAVGVTKSTVTFWKKQYLSGKDSKPNSLTAQKIADYFAVSVDYLLGGENLAKSEKTPSALNNEKTTALDSFLSMSLYDIPIFNSVSAGFGMLAVDNVDDYISLPFGSAAEAGESICIKVIGDSMSPVIQDGDLIQIHRQTSVDSGDIAVIMIDDEAFVKKITYGAEWVKLTSLNPSYENRTLKGADLLRCRVIGKLKRLIRDF